MTAMTCTELADVAPELALELVSGDERAAALAHLQRCDSCQQLVSTLTDTTDRLLLLAPSAEPPPGFERRVLAAVKETRSVRRPRRRRTLTTLVLAAAAILMVVFVLGRAPQRSFAVADMRTPAGEVVGQVLVEPDRPAALFMTLPGWTEQLRRSGNVGYAYSLRIARDDGPPRLVPMSMTAGSTWSTTVDIDPAHISSVAVIDEQGRVWCEADV